MSRRNVVIAIVVIAALIVAGIIIIKDGTPGGPIIVIHPEPDPEHLNGAKQLAEPGYSHWSFGCPSGFQTARPKKMSGITYRFAEVVHAGRLEVTQYSVGKAVPAQHVELTINSKLIEIDLAQKNSVPVWKFERTRRRGQLFSYTPDWPEDMIGVITAVSVDGSPIPVGDLNRIDVHYNRSIFSDCPK